jgi:colanic acid biosynthesis glycosyl transferase WcaI
LNNKKNILVVSPFFYPELISTGKFNTDFVVGLRDKGHNVTMLCFYPFYPNWKTKFTDKNIEGVNIIRGGLNLSFTNKTFLRRIILEISFSFFVLRKFFKYKSDLDIIIPVFPPSFFFLFLLTFISKKTKKIGMVHDLQEVYSNQKKGLVNKFISFIINKVEKTCYKGCDKIIFLSSEMKKEAQKLYKLDLSKLITQYPFITLKKNNSNELDNILKSDKINIVYSGALGEKQNPFELLNFFNEASKSINNSAYHIFSQGVFFNQLKDLNKNDNIKFHNLVDTKLLEELYLKSDVQIIPQKQGTSKGSLPSKLPNILSSQCKILVITDSNSELSKLFYKYQLDIIVESWEINKLIYNLNKIIKKNVDFSHQNRIAENLFTLDKMLDKVLR